MNTKNYIKKYISILLILSMILLVACSNNSKTEQNSNSSNNKNEKAKTTNSFSYADLKIGIINNGSSKDTSGYTFLIVLNIKVQSRRPFKNALILDVKSYLQQI